MIVLCVCVCVVLWVLIPLRLTQSFLLSRSFRPGRPRIAHVWDNSWLLRSGVLLYWNGVHLYWRSGQN